MIEILTPARAGHPTVDPVARARLTRGQELLSVGFGTWLVVGLFLDGWAHNHDKPESIFTPWHAILYSGFLACGAYSLWIVQRKAAAGRLRDTLPVGQGLVLAGVAIFALGAGGDLVWHSVFGIEADIAALLSPTHLVMFGGATLLAGPIAGLAANVLLRHLDPSPVRPWALRAFSASIPVVLWLSFFALYDLAYGVGWKPELWAGVTVMSGLSGAGLSLLVAPPAVPAAVEARQ